MSQKHLNQYAKISGLVGVFFEWLALATYFVLQPSYFDGHHPISFFATLPQTRIVFQLCYTIAAVNFWIFFRYNLSRLYKTPLRALAVSLVTFAGVALWPYNPANSISSFVHATLFLISSVTFMYGMYVISKSDIDSKFRRISTGLVTLSAVTFLIYIPFSNSSFTLPLEAGWWLILQIWIIWISCHSIRDKRLPQ